MFPNMDKTKSCSSDAILSVFFLSVLWLVPISHSQVINSTLEVPCVLKDHKIYLADVLSVNVSITFGTQSLLLLDVLVTLPHEIRMLEKNHDNLTLIVGSNVVIKGEQTKELSPTGYRLSLFDVTFVNSLIGDPLSNRISFDFDVYVRDQTLHKGQSVNISGYIDYTLTNIPHNNSRLEFFKTLSYGGPEVGASLEAEGFPSDANTTEQSITFDRELEVSVSYQMPGFWAVSGVVVHHDVQSTNKTKIAVDYIQCLITTSSSNITFSNVTNTNVTHFNRFEDVITPAHQRFRREVEQPKVVRQLEWLVGDVSNTGSDEAVIVFSIRFLLPQSSEMNDGTHLLSLLYMDLNGVSFDIISHQMVVREPQLRITKRIVMLNKYEEDDAYKIQKVRFTTTVSHAPGSLAEAYEVLITDAVEGLRVEYFSPVIRPPFGTDDLSVSKNVITFQKEKLPVGDVMELSYEAYLNEETAKLEQETPFMFEADVDWTSMGPNEVTFGHPGRSYGPLTSAACFNQLTTYEENLIFNHGLAALFFFVFIIIGFLMVIIVFLVWVKCCQNAPYSTVSPTRTTRAAESTGLILEPGNGKKSVLTFIINSSMVAINDSIILVLALKDKKKKYLEFNNLDVWATIQMDIDLEKQRLDVMKDCIITLLHQQVMHSNITIELEAISAKKFLRNVKDMLKRLEDEYRANCSELVKRLSVQNQVKLEKLRNEQKSQYKDYQNNTKYLDKQGQEEVITLTEQQHQIEMEGLSKLLRIQQNEELEKIRKEFAIKKRMAMKGLQSNSLDEVILQGELNQNQARVLLWEQKSNMATLEKLMDEEVSNQCMLLDEKLARRKAMAVANANQDEEQRNLLNMLAGQTLSPVQELQKDSKLLEDEVSEYVERVKKEMMSAKTKVEAERQRQEGNLHKKLSELKKKKLTEKTKEHKEQQEKLGKGFIINQEKDDIGFDDFMAAKFTLLAKQREELFEIEMSLDEDAAKGLATLHDEQVEKTKEHIEHTKGAILKELMNKGLTEDVKDEILEQHHRDVEQLMEEHEEQRQKQNRLLKKKLAKHRQEWSRQNQEEKIEEQQIREHGEKMVGKLLAGQIALSDDDRKHIMEEHEKQMVGQENSLALGKLRNHRLLQERLAVRKARQLQKLEQEHKIEALRQMRKAQLDSDEEESAQEAHQELMKKQMQEKLTVLCGDDEDQLEEYQEQVRDEMMHERARSLQAQEEKIGALIAQLQLEKAREIAIIEEQQKALWKLKLEMLDDMSEKGVIKNAECKRLVETHAKEVKMIEEKVNAHNVQQEKELKKRLKQQMFEWEKAFLAQQEKELEDLGAQETNGVAFGLKGVPLKHKHMVQIEEFRHKMDIELSQSVEDLRRQVKVTRLNQLQNQELLFLSALVRRGNFDPVELRKVLLLLFPSKTAEEVRHLMARLYDKDKWSSREENRASQDTQGLRDNPQKKTKVKDTSSLESKVKTAIMGETPMDHSSESNPKKLKKIKSGRLNPLKSDLRSSDPYSKSFKAPTLPSIRHRPEPLGRNATPEGDSEIDRRAQYDTDEEDYYRMKRSNKTSVKLDYSY